MGGSKTKRERELTCSPRQADNKREKKGGDNPTMSTPKVPKAQKTGEERDTKQGQQSMQQNPQQPASEANRQRVKEGDGKNKKYNIVKGQEKIPRRDLPVEEEEESGLS